MATVTVTLSPEEKALLDQLAGARQRGEEELAGEALREYLRFEAEQIRKIEEGIAAANRGDFAAEVEIEAFFARYADSR
ncbi:MAG: CopG family transcriptional regulator [Betaproteobacteria bacterium]